MELNKKFTINHLNNYQQSLISIIAYLLYLNQCCMEDFDFAVDSKYSTFSKNLSNSYKYTYTNDKILIIINYKYGKY